MKVVLKEDIGAVPNTLPSRGASGEALYFRYDENDELQLGVLFYGYPGIHLVSPEAVESLVE